MGYASRSGRAKTSSTNPRAFAVCDRCAFWYNHDQLAWQYDWAGASLVNKRLLVCRTCYDEPQQQLRAIIIPADPVPIVNPRIEPYAWDETDRRQISGNNTVNQATGIPVQAGPTRVTTASNLATKNNRVTQQTGEPPGGTNQLPGTDPNAPGNDNPGLPYGFTEVPRTGPLSPPFEVGWYNSSGQIVQWVNSSGITVFWSNT
jgi:hypothetical protein